MERDYMTTSEAAEMLGVSDSRVRQLRIDGVLTGVKRGRDWLLDRQSVEAAKKRSGRWRKKK